MNNNYYRFSLNVSDKDIIIPVEITFDQEGREQGVEEYESEVLERVINGVDDFEISKFAHAPWDTNNDVTQVHYQFNFFNPNTTTDFINNPPTITDWLDDYQYATFTDSEIYYFSNSFKGSFFKLDFYDSPQNEGQTLLLSVIIPTQQGLKEDGTIGPPLNQTSVKVKKPKFALDSVGADKEGFYVYWLKDKTYLNINEFYVSAKFFNAKIGQFVRFMNVPQSNFIGQNIFNIDKTQYFYYKYVLDYDTNEYKVYSYNANFQNAQRKGTGINPIKWYEYINP